MDKIPGQKEEKPGEEGKIIGGEKSSWWKSQVGGEDILVKGRWDGSEVNSFKAQAPPGNVAGDKKEKAGGENTKGRVFWGNFPQQLMERNHQKHRRPNQGQNPEHYPFSRHHKEGYRSHQCTPEKYHQSPFQRVFPQPPAEAGQEDKTPADALLPEITGRIAIPVCPQTEEVDQIPEGMVSGHADEGDSPQGVQLPQPVMGGKIALCHGVILL